MLFPYSLRDRAKSWLNSLEANSTATWNALYEKFVAKYFPLVKNSKMKYEITSFRQEEEKFLFDAWERFKELLRQCLYHGIPIYIQLETFDNFQVPSLRYMLDAPFGGSLLFKNYKGGYNLIESITTNTYQWLVTRATIIVIPKKPIGLHEVSENTTFSSQESKIHQMMKNMMTSSETPVAELIILVIDIIEVACVYYGESHLFEYC